MFFLLLVVCGQGEPPNYFWIVMLNQHTTTHISPRENRDNEQDESYRT